MKTKLKNKGGEIKYSERKNKKRITEQTTRQT